MVFVLSYYKKSKWYNPILRTDWVWLIQLAWGERRVSSRAASGTQAYPELVAASLSCWIAWTRQNWKRKAPYIVVSGSGADHGADYAAEIAERAAQEAMRQIRANVESRLSSLQEQRRAARAAKDFATADKIRSEIEAAGFVVNDEKVAT